MKNPDIQNLKDLWNSVGSDLRWGIAEGLLTSMNTGEPQVVGKIYITEDYAQTLLYLPIPPWSKEFRMELSNQLTALAEKGLLEDTFSIDIAKFDLHFFVSATTENLSYLARFVEANIRTFFVYKALL